MQRYLSLGKSADVDYPSWVPVGGELLIMPRWESRIVRGNAVPKHNYQGLPSRIAVRRPDSSA